jgi:ABC-type multidrug transport system fused ATPase/permease subunit
VLPAILELVALPMTTDPRGTVEPLPLGRGIDIDNVSFTYPGRPTPALNAVTMPIRRGAAIGLIGRTGSGKSTLADVLMGLLDPQMGHVAVGGVPITSENRHRWWQSIAHVPQSIFLADDTIARNIAFGAEAIDMDRVKLAATRAQLHNFVESLPDGYDTHVGERGVRISGGQRQRLGLARAIYKQAPVLILDEATSALDDATEAAVMGAIAELAGEGRTIIVIAHRLSTVARCDFIARFHEGKLVEFGARDEVLRQPPQARRSSSR